MKSSKAYHIAYKYQKKGRLDQLLTNNILETGNHKASDSETLLNIFNDNQEMRLRNLDLSREKQYNIVGIGEFSVYSRIKERRKRDLRSNGDQKKIGTYISVRTSRQPAQNAGYLTKEQVLKFCSPQSSKQELSNPIQEYLLSFSKQNHNDTNISCIISPRNKIPFEINFKEKFSLSKLKSKVEDYQKIWKKYSQRKEVPITSFSLKKKCKLKENQKYGYYQLKRHRLCKPKNLYSAIGINSLPWSETLRTNSDDLVLKDEYVQRIDPNGLTLTGDCKLKKETQWIEKKYNEGFYFQKKTSLDLSATTRKE